MGRDCCGPPSPTPETPAAPISAPTDGTGSCQDSCCDGDNAAQSDDCCSPGQCTDDDDKTEHDTGAPDCCRGKVGPCCDASCLSRLAFRECEESAAAAAVHGPDKKTGTCKGALDGKACSQHSLSAFDRYGATLQALGCVCRALIALGQETCCEIRERHALVGDRLSDKSAATSPVRTSLDSCCSSGSVTKDQAVRNRLRVQRSFGGSTRLVKKPSADACAGSCCSEDKPRREAPIKRGSSKTCCSHANSDGYASPEGTCADPCLTDERAFKEAPTAESERLGSCCSGNGPGVEAQSSGRAGPFGGALEQTITKDALAAVSSGSVCKPPEESNEKTAKARCTESCCADELEVKPQTSCGKTCCSSRRPERVFEIEKLPIQVGNDVENQGNGIERVILSISGMTCTGCETKLNRTLATVPAVENLKTNLVLSRAVFNLDLRISSAEEVMKHLERTTEFKCERVQDQGSHIDLVVRKAPLDFISQTWPEGVLDMALVGKQTVRVAYDAKIVGARDLTERIWGPPTELASPSCDPSLEVGRRHVRNLGFLTLLSAVLTIPVLVMAWATLPQREVAYSSASLALATVIQVLIAGPFYPKALKALIFSKVIEMDLLIVLSTSAAYIFSVVSFGFLVVEKPLSTGQFFETSTLLVTLIMVGRWVAALARQRAIESISIRSLQAPMAILVDKEGGTGREIDARLLQYGDTFKVLPDTRIPTDGTVIAGSSEVDESLLTGESRPVEKHPRSAVIAGSINGSGVITVGLNRLPGDNTINTIATMVDEARLSKPKLQDLADRVASYFVPVVLALTIITFVVWVAVGVTVYEYNGSEATIQAITYAITVLIVSCPCAIGLAVPMVVVVASGVTAEKGIIFKSANAIEVAHKTSHVVFDKTGTLTRGKLTVVAKDCVDADNLPLLLGLISNSRHPVSVAVAAHLKGAGIQALTVSEPKSLTGRGVETTVVGQKLRAGNSRWLNLSDHELVRPMLAQGLTVFCFTIDNAFKAVFGLEDELRPEAAGTVEALQERNVSVHMVSGDDDGAVQTLAFKLGIPSTNVRSRSSPADKRDYIQTLLGPGKDDKKAVIVFCGDGANDAVALAQATIGIHMNEGSDVAQSAADVVLVHPSLRGILTMMNASRKSVNRIKFNFAWSFVYNTFAVLLAAGAFVHARIPPKFAGLGELVSVLPVIAAAVLLRWSTI